MKLKNPDEKDKFSENKHEQPNFIKYLIGSAILLFALIIGYNAFIVPDTDLLIKSNVDNISIKEEKTDLSEGKININKAKQEELMELRGIGEQTALKIINYRETHGGFSSKEEITEVSGIGAVIFERIKNQITI